MNVYKQMTGSRPFPFDAERASRIKAELGKRLMSIQALADATGYQRSHVSALISGRLRSAAMEESIAAFLRLPKGYLFPRRTVADLARMRQEEAQRKEAS